MQKELHGFECAFVLVYVCLVGFLFVVCFDVLVFFFFRKREKTQSMVDGEMRKIWEELSEGKEYNQNIVSK